MQTPAVSADVAPPRAAGPRDARAETRAAPRTARELTALRQQRDELTEQLVGTHARRGELVGEMEQTDPAARGVLKQQMVELDRRVLQLETDMSNTVHLIATAPASLGAGDESGPLTTARGVMEPRGFYLLGPNGPSPNAVPLLLLLITLLQLLMLVRGRARRPAAAPADALLRDSAARLARVEQAVDAIAVEVERVSEGQRFVTRVLGEQTAPAPRLAQQPRPHHTPA